MTQHTFRASHTLHMIMVVHLSPALVDVAPTRWRWLEVAVAKQLSF